MNGNKAKKQMVTVCAMAMAMAVVAVAVFFFSVMQQPETVYSGDVGAMRTKPVYDVGAGAVRDLRILRTYLQDDARWADVPYAEGTISTDGCGLVCAAIALEHVTGFTVTPLELAANVGDSCLTYGANDMRKFVAWMRKNYNGFGFRLSNAYHDLNQALEDAQKGRIVFASLVGAFGEREYEGHIIIICGANEDGFTVRDPKSKLNSAHSFSHDELDSVSWAYFYTLEGM